jgi:serine/threonine-protein kinase
MGSVANIDVEGLIGTEVGTSTILRELGRGGMAIVFAAYQRTLKRQIALKILPKDVMNRRTAERFQQEAESAAILSHPNILPVFEVGETEGFLYMAMQMVQGESLGQRIEKAKRHLLPSRRRLPMEESLRVVCCVLDALHYAHHQDIVHRDIKPDNILMERHTERPLVTDFGLATVLRGEEDEKPMIQGTPVYMPPEQVMGRSVDGRSDVYAVGTMLFKLLSPDLPFPPFDSKLGLLKAKLARKQGFFVKKPSEVNPEVDGEMDRIVARATAYRMEDRYATCRDFMKDLEAYRKGIRVG